jgi:hypothetical protein
MAANSALVCDGRFGISLPCLSVCTVSGCNKNAPGRDSASSGHITKLGQSTFLRCL